MALSDFLGFLARQGVRSLVRFYYPRMEVTGGEHIPRSGPVLLVANHPNSLIDPVMLGIAARRPVRLLAKAPLFDLPLFGAVLRALGMVPAYRGGDNAREVGKNLESLALGARQLADGRVLGIFPEGKSHDAARLELVRSGAARLAVQAVAAGAQGLQVVPVGLHYQRKERFRSAVWIKVGEPIDAAGWLAQHEGDAHRAMRTLTAEIERRLKAAALHLDEAAWEPLLEEIEALLPAAGFRRRDALEALKQRKAVVDAINHFHRTDRPRAEAAAARVRAHDAALRAAGVPDDARLMQFRGWRLAASLLGTGAGLFFGGVFGLLGLLFHAVPYAVVRLVVGLMPSPGRMTIALNRLLFSLPVYAAWYAWAGWKLGGYFLPWVVWTWIALMPFAALAALGTVRRLRRVLPQWRAEVGLFFRPGRMRSLRLSQEAVTGELRELAAEFREVSPPAPEPVPRSVRYRPPVWLNLTIGAVCLALTGGLVTWLLRDRPLEVFAIRAPDLQALPAAELSAQLDGDERALVAIIHGLDDLAAKARGFEAELADGRRSYYRQADDDEIRRMLATFLARRAALLRLVWVYQENEAVTDQALRLRALLLHYAAAAVAYDSSTGFVRMFAENPEAIRKLNEGEPRWDLPAGVYDRIRANLANAGHRRWLEAGWANYQATLPRWTALSLGPEAAAGSAAAEFHTAIARAGENADELKARVLAYKLGTARAEVRGLAKGSYYRAGAAVSTLIGDTKIREPRRGAALVTPELLAQLRVKLQPGDILLERRNWYLSNAFLPGYWPHSALYVGTAEELKAQGLDQDLRILRHRERFARPDAVGHRPAIIEAVSEGVVFSTVEHSLGGADSVAVLRPRLNPAQRRELIARAFSHAGKPYDFDFDFFSSDKLVCTEVVYRSCSGMVDFPLVEILGRRTLPALEIVRYWVSPEGGPKLDFVGFLDGNEATGECKWGNAGALADTLRRPALTWLQP